MDSDSNLMGDEISAVFDTYPQEMKAKLLDLRTLIYETASMINGVDIEEALKWGQPSYLTPKSKSGSTIRLAWKESEQDQYSIFFKCTANLVPAFREQFPETFDFGGNRSINFRVEDEVPVTALKQCIALALTYHRNKQLEPSARWETVKTIR